MNWALPLKLSSSLEDDVTRVPLQKTNEQIASDLAIALTSNIPLLAQGKAKHWRANTAAIHGFAARYYLYKNDIKKARSYADKAREEYPVLANYNTEMRYGLEESIILNGGTTEASVFTAIF